MLADRLRDRHEDHAGLGQFLLEGGHDGDGIEHRVDRHLALLHAGEDFLLRQRNAELLIGLQQFRIDLVERARSGHALRRGIVIEIVEIDLRILDARPGRLFHGQPAAIGVETPFQHPVRLLFFAEMNRMMSSLRPFGALSLSMTVSKPYLYWSTSILRT
jgi:hypothetical protein